MPYVNQVAGRRPRYYGPRWLGNSRPLEPQHWSVIYRSRPQIAAEELSAGDLVQLLADNFADVFRIPMTGEHLTICVELYLAEVKKIPHGRPRCQMAKAWVWRWLSEEWK